jgi:hypothetical protein
MFDDSLKPKEGNPKKHRMPIHFKFQSQDGIESIVLCGKGKHQRKIVAPAFNPRNIPTDEKCILCHKDGVRYCECGGVAHNIIQSYGKEPKEVCPICAERSPLGTMVRPLPGAKEISRSKYDDLPVEQVESDESLGGD